MASKLKQFVEKRGLLFTVAASVCLSVGCSPVPSDANQDYQARLSHVLGVEVQTNPLPALPSLKKPELPQAEKISLIELGKLNQCKLSQLIAHHNTQLGKTAYPSELLKYQISFLKQLSLCTEKLNENEFELKSILTNSYEQKLRTLPVYFNNMIAGESELQRLFRLTHNEFVSSDMKQVQASFEAITYFVTLKQQISKHQFEDINEQMITTKLGVLNNNNAVAAIISSSLRQIAFNETSSHALKQLDFNQLCTQSDKAKIASNVFQKFFIKQIQPYQASLTSTLETLSPQLYTLLENQTDLQGLFAPNQNTSLLTRLKTSAKAHVSWWQQFYDQCKINPYL